MSLSKLALFAFAPVSTSALEFASGGGVCAANDGPSRTIYIGKWLKSEQCSEENTPKYYMKMTTNSFYTLGETNPGKAQTDYLDNIALATSMSPDEGAGSASDSGEVPGLGAGNSAVFSMTGNYFGTKNDEGAYGYVGNAAYLMTAGSTESATNTFITPDTKVENVCITDLTSEKDKNEGFKCDTSKKIKYSAGTFKYSLFGHTAGAAFESETADMKGIMVRQTIDLSGMKNGDINPQVQFTTANGKQPWMALDSDWTHYKGIVGFAVRVTDGTQVESSGDAAAQPNQDGTGTGTDTAAEGADNSASAAPGNVQDNSASVAPGNVQDNSASAAITNAGNVQDNSASTAPTVQDSSASGSVITSAPTNAAATAAPAATTSANSTGTNTDNTTQNTSLRQLVQHEEPKAIEEVSMTFPQKYNVGHYNPSPFWIAAKERLTISINAVKYSNDAESGVKFDLDYAFQATESGLKKGTGWFAYDPSFSTDASAADIKKFAKSSISSLFSGASSVTMSLGALFGAAVLACF